MNRNRIRIILTAVLLITLIAGVLLFAFAKSPERYCKRCLYSNVSDFDSLVHYVRQYDLSGEVEVGDSDIPQEIEQILERLNDQYQQDSDYPVFTSIVARHDDNGNIYISVQAEKHRNKGGDGQNSPDIRCCCLVYVDPDYSESVMEMSVDPFYDNWRVWSSDIWSG